MDVVSNVLFYAIGILVLFIVLKLFSLPLKLFLKLAGNAIIGGLFLLLINWIGTPLGFTLPVTIWTCLLVGFLGVPGVLGLALFTFLL